MVKIFGFLLVAVFIIQEIISINNESLTFDEPDHLTSGFTAVKFRNFRSDYMHPVLIKELAVIPTLNYPSSRSYIEANPTLFWPRMMVVTLSAVLAIVLFYFVKSLTGGMTAIIALWLFVFEPNILAHSHYVTTDMGGAIFYFFTHIFLWRYLEKKTIKNLLNFAVLLGIALSTRHSNLIFLSISLLILFIIKLIEDKFRVRLKISLGRVILFLVTVFFTIWSAYLFDIRSLRQDQYANTTIPNIFIEKNNNSIWWDIPIPAPGYLTSLMETVRYNQSGGVSYLFGQIKGNGWWFYFPVAFFLKTPIPLIISFMAGLYFYRDRKWRKRLLIPIAAVFFVGIFSKMNIGLRYILPVYPFVIVFSALFLGQLIRTKKGIVLVIFLLIWQALSTLKSTPYYLTYFNEIVLDPTKKQELLLDSNLDWGQGLIALRKYTDKISLDLYLSYWGSVDPKLYKIDYRGLPTHVPTCRPVIDAELADLSGIIAVSMNNWQLCGYKNIKRLKDKWPPEIIGGSIFVFR